MVVTTDQGMQTLTLFGEAGLSPPVSMTNVSVAKGASTLITIAITGAGSSSPALQIACNGGEHVSAVAILALGPLGIAMLLGLLGATAYWRLRDSASAA